MCGQAGFFDVDDRLKRLSDLGDQLEAFRAAVDFETFRPDLNAALSYSDGSQGGRPPFDPVISVADQDRPKDHRSALVGSALLCAASGWCGVSAQWGARW